MILSMNSLIYKSPRQGLMGQIGAYWFVNFEYMTGLCRRDKIILNLLQNLFTEWIQRVNIIISFLS